MDLLTIQATIHNRLLKLRALDRLVFSKQFGAALAMAKDEPPLDNPDALELWIEKTLQKDLDDLSMGQLRVRASKLKIPFYTSYNKADLILKILEVQNARKAQTTPVGVPSENGRHDLVCASEVGREVLSSTSS